MNPEVKRIWIEALRSGEFVQGKMRLHTIDPVTGQHKYCCLGVLCKLAEDNGICQLCLIGDS